MRDEIDKLKKRLGSYIDMKADGDITVAEYQERSKEVRTRIAELQETESNLQVQSAVAERKLFDMERIKQMLDTFVNLKEEKVCGEMIDMFVKRIIYRGNNEFLWVINLSGDAVGSEAKYRIPKYSKEYADSLSSDKDFDIVAQFLFPKNECQKYCEGVAKRRFVPKYWKEMVIKIAVW